MEPFVYAGLNDITFILICPFNKEVGKYLDFNFGKRVLIGNFKTFIKAHYAIINA